MGEDLDGLAPLSEAIEALRAELVSAWYSGAKERVRFRPSPVELTLQVAVTTGRKASGGVKWYLVTAEGGASRESVVTQTVRLTLDPVVVDEDGQEVEYLIDDAENGKAGMAGSQPQVPLDDVE